MKSAASRISYARLDAGNSLKALYVKAQGMPGTAGFSVLKLDRSKRFAPPFPSSHPSWHRDTGRGKHALPRCYAKSRHVGGGGGVGEGSSHHVGGCEVITYHSGVFSLSSHTTSSPFSLRIDFLGPLDATRAFIYGHVSRQIRQRGHPRGEEGKCDLGMHLQR